MSPPLVPPGTPVSATLQSAAQSSPPTVLPSSQVSPTETFHVPSPHSARVQSASHEADSPVSSQSSPVSVTPSPQPARVQSVRQASGIVSELPAPSSHASGVSWIPSPQMEAMLRPNTYADPESVTA